MKAPWEEGPCHGAIKAPRAGDVRLFPLIFLMWLSGLSIFPSNVGMPQSVEKYKIDYYLFDMFRFDNKLTFKRGYMVMGFYHF